MTDVVLALSMLAYDKLDEIMDSQVGSLEFLKFLSYNYKYDFPCTLSIYAQYPTATAVADFDFWTDRAHLKIKAGSKGIRIFSKMTRSGTYARIFDISQTYGDKRVFNKMRWHYDKQANGSIVDDVFISNIDTTADISNVLLNYRTEQDGTISPQDIAVAYATAIIIANRLDMNISLQDENCFLDAFFSLTKEKRDNTLMEAHSQALYYLSDIEREIQNENHIKRTGIHSEGQRSGDKEPAISIQTGDERNRGSVDSPTGWDADIRYRGDRGDEPTNPSPRGANTDIGVQQTIHELSHGKQQGTVQSADTDGRIPQTEGENRQGLFSKILKLSKPAEKGNQRKEPKLSGKPSQAVTNQRDSSGTDTDIYVGNLRTNSIAPQEEPAFAQGSSFFIGDTIVLDGESYWIVDTDPELNKIVLEDLSYKERTGIPLRKALLLSAVEEKLGCHILDQDKYRFNTVSQPIPKSPSLAEIIAGTDTTLPVEEKEKQAAVTLQELLNISEERLSSGGDEVSKQESPQPATANYVLNDDFNESGGLKTKFKANIAAITLLKQLEKDEKSATIEEQQILSKYTGWGGLSSAFNEVNKEWTNEYSQLLELLTQDEYESARSSVLTAYYTSKPIVSAIYTALANFGFSSGNILDPACGIGNFFGYMPENLKSSNLYGVEIDSLSGRIARQLYPNANIQISGFEDTAFSNNFFDVAIGNIPFGDIKVFDTQYNRLNFNIHDYFFAKAIDKTRDKGIIAFVTTKGTLDKKDSKARRYIFERCDLIGAVRLPNNAFQSAGTEVTADIIFLQKRESLHLDDTPYLSLKTISQDIEVNEYFAQNPSMILGVMEKNSNMYGNLNDIGCSPYPGGESLEKLLAKAISSLTAHIPVVTNKGESGLVPNTIPATESVCNFSYAIIDDKLYYRENSIMTEQAASSERFKKMQGYCSIRDTLKDLLKLQATNVPDSKLMDLRTRLNEQYDNFTAKFGHLSNRNNELLFMEDIDSNLVLALEKSIDDEVKKTDIFYTRTVSPRAEISSAKDAHDALVITLGVKGFVDFDYMQKLYGKEKNQILQELGEAVYINPEKYENVPFQGYESADEYLSGDIYKKIAIAKIYAETDKSFEINVEALEKAIPTPLAAADIDVRMGATWIDTKYYKEFTYKLLNTPAWKQAKENASYRGGTYIDIAYDKRTGVFRVSNSRIDDSANAVNIYGTSRINAYQIIEQTLNLQTVTIKDSVPHITAAGNESVRYRLNRKETDIARQKQEMIKAKFKEWIFDDTSRRKELEDLYNRTFNSIKLRQYDGSTLTLPDLNEGISLRPSQLSAVARMRSGNNALLAHVVGAGKTYAMVVGAYEQIRIGMANKAMFVVPNHIVKQFADDIRKLYPNVRLLYATKKDFEKNARQRFLSKIALSDVQMVVVGHSQFEKIQVPPEYQQQQIKADIAEICDAIEAIKEEKGTRYTVKQMEKQRENLEIRLKKLTDTSKKDKMITFDMLGIGSLIVDEAHYFKNCAIFSKMNNVSGISSSAAMKSSDMLMKTKYLSENKGIATFATGTPLSNSMCEIYVLQRYLQNELLISKGIRHFDEWASAFGETVTSLEPTPEGNGLRNRTRFSKFHNLPELMNMFQLVADIQTADMLDLPVPKTNGGKPYIVSCQPSNALKLFMKEGVERVERIRSGLVEPTQDNMLKFITDFRKAGLDMRLLKGDGEFDTSGKLFKCAENIYREYLQSGDTLGAQLVFCDSSTYNPQAPFDVYREMKRIMTDMGIPNEEIAFIHEAKNEKHKEAIFKKVRCGEIRILLGSTQKCGAGTNIQERLIALHHLDCPYRPSDIEQREGRILRQGNTNESVSIYRYVTEESFDSYLWNILLTKQRFIAQFMQGSSVERSFDDIDEVSISFAEAQAIATGDPRIKEKIELDNEVQRLTILKNQYLKDRYDIKDKVDIILPKKILEVKERISSLELDVKVSYNIIGKEQFSMELSGISFDNREKAGEHLLGRLLAVGIGQQIKVGTLGDFKIIVEKPNQFSEPLILIKGNFTYRIETNLQSPMGNIMRIENSIKNIPTMLENNTKQLSELESSLASLWDELSKPFALESEFVEKSKQLSEVNIALDVSGKDSVDISPTDDIEDMEKENFIEENELSFN